MSVVTTVKSAYAAGARGVGRGLRRVGVLGDEPPARTDRWRHWAYSLFCAHDSLAIAELDVPWWTYGAIDEVERWLDHRAAPVRVFEWGSGASTVWLAKRVDSVDSVEHHRGFGEMLQGELADLADRVDVRASHVDLVVIEPVRSDAPVVGSKKEGMAGLDFADYVGRIDVVGGTFDLIVIDGRAREACLTAALPHLADDGIIVFDNTQRRRYRAAIDAAAVTSARYRGLTPTLPYPDETSIVRPG
ncbi:MAG: SAM-dependent methyltransferase [Acidimicrobiaceae bacterium]|nr:SAM-dependent methyltransferase [Acidimicrobiaceae bacterium]